MYKKILVPVDLAHKERAPEMIAAAKQLADTDSQFILVNIVQYLPTMADMAFPPDYFETANKEAQDSLKEIAQAEKFDAKIEIRMGHPASDILTVAEDEGADLVIIASHKPGFQDYLLGSTAARVVRHAQCPVLVMR